MHLHDKSDISAVSLDSALRVLNPPAKRLAHVHLSQLYDQEHIGGTALDCICLLEHQRIGAAALDSALRFLRPPNKFKDVDVEETSPKQEEEIKEEPYDEPWCMPGTTSPEPPSIEKQHVIEG